jgi:hypothetical protein
VRAREDLRGDLMRVRHRLSKLLLRHDIRYEDTTSRWGERHRAWLAKVDLGARGAQLAVSDYVGAIDALELRRKTIEAAIGELVPASPWAQTVARLRCLRGIDTLSAVGLAAEIGDFERFEHPRQLMSYLGVVPSEHSTGGTRRQGHITKTGSRHARRLLIEAAWPYRRPPRLGTTLERRQDGQDPRGGRDRLEGPAATASRVAAAGRPARQAKDGRRGRGRPPTRRVLLGDRLPRAALRRRGALMSSFRYDIEACAGPATERLLDGSSRLLVRVRMFDDGIEHPQPEVLCDLSPDQARELGFCLLASAEYADCLSSMPSSASIPAGGRPPHADPQPPKHGDHQP